MNINLDLSTQQNINELKNLNYPNINYPKFGDNIQYIKQKRDIIMNNLMGNIEITNEKNYKLPESSYRLDSLIFCLAYEIIAITIQTQCICDFNNYAFELL